MAAARLVSRGRRATGTARLEPAVARTRRRSVAVPHSFTQCQCAAGCASVALEFWNRCGSVLERMGQTETRRRSDRRCSLDDNDDNNDYEERCLMSHARRHVAACSGTLAGTLVGIQPRAQARSHARLQASAPSLACSRMQPRAQARSIARSQASARLQACNRMQPHAAARSGKLARTLTGVSTLAGMQLHAAAQQRLYQLLSCMRFMFANYSYCMPLAVSMPLTIAADNSVAAVFCCAVAVWHCVMSCICWMLSNIVRQQGRKPTRTTDHGAL